MNISANRTTIMKPARNRMLRRDSAGTWLSGPITVTVAMTSPSNTTGMPTQSSRSPSRSSLARLRCLHMRPSLGIFWRCFRGAQLRLGSPRARTGLNACGDRGRRDIVSAMRISALIFALALTLSACGDDGSSDEDSIASEPPTPTQVVTVTESVAPECEPPTVFDARLLAERWTLVVASYGARDHAHYAEEFFDGAEELSEEFEDGNCAGGPAVTAAKLAYQASLVNAWSRLDGGEKYYAQAARVGNRLLEQMDAEDAQFISITCVGFVDEIPECRGLT